MRHCSFKHVFAGGLLVLATQSGADAPERFVLVPPTIRPADVIVQRDAFRRPLPQFDGAVFALPDETQTDIDRVIEDILRNNPRFQGGIIDLSDGRRLAIDRQGGEFLVSPTGGAVGGLPSAGTRLPVDAPTVISVVDRGGRVIIPMTGEQVGELFAEDGATPCGANTADPSTHCAQSTVRLIDRDDGLFCTGVAITDTHILTAAHCLCDRQTAGQLTDDIHVRFGIGPFFHALHVLPKIEFFDAGTGNYCANGQTAGLSADNGDLAILTLHDPDLGDAQSPIDLVAASIMAIGEQAGRPLDAGEVGRLRAFVGEGTAETWSPDSLVGNGFAIWGWGDGPDGVAGTKRAMIYAFAELLPCLGPDSAGECAGIQEALFDDRDHGLCAGDSGAGVFKPVDPDPAIDPSTLAGFDRWALMGIVSGDISPADCHSTDGVLLADHHPRNITRIDTPMVAEWLDNVTEETVRRTPVRMNYEAIVADRH